MNIDSFPGGQETYQAPQQSRGGGGGGNFEQELLQLQQGALTQAIILKLADMSFEKCIERPSSSFSSSERACIYSSARKFIDASELVVNKLQGGQ